LRLCIKGSRTMIVGGPLKALDPSMLTASSHGSLLVLVICKGKGPREKTWLQPTLRGSRSC
jgi:hypothetical protein